MTASNPPPPVRWGRIAIILGVLFGLVIIWNESRRPFRAWSAQRAAWHTRCDAYRETPLTDPTARACNDELQALVATAKRKGWL